MGQCYPRTCQPIDRYDTLAVPVICGSDTDIPLSILSQIIGHFSASHNCAMCYRTASTTGYYLIIYRGRLYVTNDQNTNYTRRFLKQNAKSGTPSSGSPSDSVMCSESKTPPIMRTRAWGPCSVPSTWIPVQDWKIEAQSLFERQCDSSINKTHRIWMHPACARRIERDLNRGSVAE
jgi:hypothetical protein